MPSLRYLPYFFCACFLLMSGPRAEENTIAVEYQGRQIQIEARFNKPSGPGPFPAVIVVHTCDGIDSQSSTIGVWAALMQAQGYATLRPDSFTGARIWHGMLEHRRGLDAGSRSGCVCVRVLARRPPRNPG